MAHDRHGLGIQHDPARHRLHETGDGAAATPPARRRCTSRASRSGHGKCLLRSGAISRFRNLTFRYRPADLTCSRHIGARPFRQDRRSASSANPGAGKTTLASLLFHLYPVERGRLFVDGHESTISRSAAARAAIAYVPQDSFLFSDTIAAQHRFRHRQRPRPPAGAVEACGKTGGRSRRYHGIYRRLCHADRRTRGHAFRRPEAARRARPRALGRWRRSCILDDALSAVDAATEAEIRSARTIRRRHPRAWALRIIIAHRISTVRQCDARSSCSKTAASPNRATTTNSCSSGGFYSTLCRAPAA